MKTSANTYKEVGKTTNMVVYTLESDPDVLIIVPRARYDR